MRRVTLGCTEWASNQRHLVKRSAVTVISKSRDERGVGRQWTTEGAKSGWRCGVVSRDSVAKELSVRTPKKIKLNVSGTIIRWDEVRDFQRAKGRVDAYLNTLTKTLVEHLGLQFHRFLESPKLLLEIEAMNTEIGVSGPALRVWPLNPFGYPVSGDPNYPKTFNVALPEVGKLRAVAHIWPPRSRTAEYRLGSGKVSGRQGFYFYRNDRLVQAGGWNMVRGDDAEPHLSLARVSVDIPAKASQFFSVRFNKAGVSSPRTFADAVRVSTADDGTSFEEYIAAAIEVYRTRTEPKLPPVLPAGYGLRAEVRAAVDTHLPVLPKEEGVRIVWDTLPPSQFFSIDREERTLTINRRFRKFLLGGTKASKADAPLIKSLLFLLTNEAFMTRRVSAIERKTLDSYSRVLAKAAELEGEGD